MYKNPLQERKPYARSLGSYLQKLNVSCAKLCGPPTWACKARFAFSSDKFSEEIYPPLSHVIM